jgi:hypothetical protein
MLTISNHFWNAAQNSTVWLTGSYNVSRTRCLNDRVKIPLMHYSTKINLKPANFSFVVEYVLPMNVCFLQLCTRFQEAFCFFKNLFK